MDDPISTRVAELDVRPLALPNVLTTEMTF